MRRKAGRATPIRESDIDRHESMCRFVPSLAHSLGALLEAHGQSIDPDRERVLELIPDLDQFAFQPLHTKMMRLVEGRLLWSEAYHQAMHILVASKYGHNQPGQPIMTILMEVL